MIGYLLVFAVGIMIGFTTFLMASSNKWAVVMEAVIKASDDQTDLAKMVVKEYNLEKNLP